MRQLFLILVCCASLLAHAQPATTQPLKLVGQQLLEREQTGVPGQAPLYICARGAKPIGDDIEVAGPCVIRSDERGFMLVADLGLKIHIRDQETITVDGQFTSSAGATGDQIPSLMRATHASFLFNLVIPR